MGMALLAAERSSCSRLKVGAIITSWDGTQVVGIGYNGNARGLPNACDRKDPGRCGCVHAETNALIKAPYDRGDLIMYVTHSPCEACAKLIINSAVKRVIYNEVYRDPVGLELMQYAGLVVDSLEEACQELQISDGG